MRKWLLIIPLLLVALFYGVLPSLAKTLTRNLLAEQGIATRQLDIEHPGWNTLLIPVAEFSRASDGQTTSLRAENIAIRYSATGLLLHNRLQSITVDSLTAGLHTGSAIQAQAPADITIPALLPEDLFRQFPVDSLAVQALQLSFRRDAQPAIRLTGAAALTADRLKGHGNIRYGDHDLPLQFVLDDTNQLALTLGNPERPLLQSGLTLHTPAPQPGMPQRLHIETQQRLNLTVLGEQLPPALLQALFSSAAPLPAIEGTLHLTGSSDLPIATRLNIAELSHSLFSEQQLQAQLRMPQPLTDMAMLTLNIDASVTHREGLLHTQLHAAEADIQGWHPGSAAGSQLDISRLKIQLAPLRLSAELPTLLAQLGNGQVPAIAFPELTLTLSGSPVRLVSAQHPLEIAYQPATLTLQTLDLAQSLASGTLTSAAIETTSARQQIPRMAISSQFDLSPQQLSNRFVLRLLDQRLPSGELAISGSSRTAFAATADSGPLTTAHWKMQTLPLKGIEKILSDYLPDLPPELQISGGELQHRGWLDLNRQGPALRLLQSITSLQGSYDQTRVFDANWQSETLRSHRGTLSDSGSLAIGFIDAGLPVEALASRYRYTLRRGKAARLSIDSSSANLLGGEVTTLPVSFDPRAPQFETAIALTNIDLGKVIALEQQPGLSGEGTLNGQMPLKFAAHQLSISNGQINSTPQGGWIRFSPPADFLALARTTPSLALALDALRNLHYNSLAIQLDYSHDGTANLQTRLKGHNPDWNNGQPIDLSLNIEENIPQLLKTLQFTDELTRTIEKRYR